jgi:chaperone modulatory protein CbpM
MEHAVRVTVEIAEVLDGSVFSAEELARACGVTPGWVQARVAAGVLPVDDTGGGWRFSSLTLVRARRILQLETIFDADPQLAALTADLIEELTRARRQLAALSRQVGGG